MIVSYSVETLAGTRHIKVEIQIRTLAMNFWSTIEHSLQYKYKKHMPDHIREKLSRAADAVVEVVYSIPVFLKGDIGDVDD